MLRAELETIVKEAISNALKPFGFKKGYSGKDSISIARQLSRLRQAIYFSSLSPARLAHFLPLVYSGRILCFLYKWSF